MRFVHLSSARWYAAVRSEAQLQRERTSGRLVCVALASIALAVTLCATPAFAASPAWTIVSTSSPTAFASGDETGEDTYVLTAVNSGEGSTAGKIELTDTLPSGIVPSTISGADLGNGKALACTLVPQPACTYEGFEVAPGDVLEVRIAVDVKSNTPSQVVNTATVAGGGASTGATGTDPTTIGAGPAFGVSSFLASWSSTQAGGHANVTTGLTLNQVVNGAEVKAVANPKDVELELPEGFLLNPLAVPTCTTLEASAKNCPSASAVGVMFASTASGAAGPPNSSSSLIYNLAPSPGQQVALLFALGGGDVVLSASGPSPEHHYRMRLIATNMSEIAPLLSMTMTLWAIPEQYNSSGAGPDSVLSGAHFGSPGFTAATSFLINGSSCSAGALTSLLSVDSWSDAGVYSQATSQAPTLTGCQNLSFEPTLAVAPVVELASTPSGYTMDLEVPRLAEEPEGLAGAELKDAVLRMPPGAAFSLSATDGLETCSEAQVALLSSALSMCPETSKVGSFEIKTPLLANPLEGAVFMASPEANPLGSLLAVYLVAEDPVSGMRVKLAGAIQADPVNGTVSFALHELPQLPLSDLNVRLFGGARALLTTPSACGLATVESELTPWSGNASTVAESSFAVANCSTQFQPSLRATAALDPNGTYGSLTLVVSMNYPEEQLRDFSLQIPSTVETTLENATPCGELQASYGTCPVASMVGKVTLAAGPGPERIYPEGDVYLTGPYKGVKEGLSIVIPLLAGPIDLGTVVIRATLQTEPVLGQATIAFDPLPALVDGIPLFLDGFALELQDGEFTVNPTTCEPFANHRNRHEHAGSFRAGARDAARGRGLQSDGHGSKPANWQRCRSHPK